MAAYTERFTGSLDVQGDSNSQGTIHFTSLTIAKPANLNNNNVIFKVQLHAVAEAGNKNKIIIELKVTGRHQYNVNLIDP